LTDPLLNVLAQVTPAFIVLFGQLQWNAPQR
jgi:hypothetical protein